MTQRLNKDLLCLLARYSIYIALAIDELGHLGIDKCIKYKTLGIEHDNTKGWKISIDRDSVTFRTLYVDDLGRIEIGDTPEKIDRLKVIRAKHVRALVKSNWKFTQGGDSIEPVSFKHDDKEYSGFLIASIQLIVYWIPVESVQTWIHLYDTSGGYKRSVRLYHKPNNRITMHQVSQIIGDDHMDMNVQ